MISKKKLLAMLLLGAAIGAGAFAFGGCADDGNEGDSSSGTDIVDPDVPLDQNGCKHEDVNHVEAVDAGCVTGGNKEYWFCDDCDKYFADADLKVETSLAAVTLGAVGHSYGELIAEKPATCQTTGVIAHYHCSECGNDFDADKNSVTDLVIHFGSHVFGEMVEEIPATCTEDGVKAYKDCSVCGKHFNANDQEITDLVIAAGHRYGDLIAEVPAEGCNSGVKAHYHCDVCNTDFDENKEEFNGLPFPIGNGLIIIPAPHNIKDYPAEEASCVVDGHEDYRQCSDCEEYFDAFGNVTEGPMFLSGDHNYGELIDEVPATCTENGVKAHYHCDLCGINFDGDENVLEDLVIPSAGHAYGELIDEVPATCTENGVKAHYHCEVCGLDFDGDKNVLEDLVIASTGHEYGEFEYDYDAKKYVKICGNDSTHIQEQAAGTEEYPYLVNDEASFIAAIAEGGYLKVENDFELQEVLNLNNDIHLNLNDCTIKITAATTRPLIVGEGVALTIEGGSVVIPEENKSVYGIIDVPNVGSKLVIKDVTLSGNTNAGALIRAQGNNSDITLDNVTSTTNYLVLNMRFVSGTTLSGKLTVNGGEYNLINKDSELTPGEKSNYYAGFNVWSNCPQDVSILTAEFNNVVINTVSKAGVSVSASTVVYNNCTIGDAQENANYGYLNSAVSTSWAGKVTVNGGTYMAKYAAYVFSSGGTIEINGGKFIGDFKCDTDASDNLCAANAVINVNKSDVEFDWNGSYISNDLSATYDCIFNNAYAGTEKYPYLVNDDASLISALANGGYVRLENNISVTTSIKIDKDVVVDLNGKTLTTNQTIVVGVNKADATPVATIKNGTVARKRNSAPKSPAAALSAQYFGTLNLENCTVSSNFDSAITVWDEGVIEAKDCHFIGAQHGFSTNAGPDSYTNKLRAKFVDCTFDAQNAGILWNIPANLEVINCEISAVGQGIIARGGNITVTDTTVTKRAKTEADTGLYVDEDYLVYENGNWGSGSSVPGYAIVVGNRSTSYQWATGLELNNVKVVIAEGVAADYAGKTVYAYGNTAEGYGATITYDKDCDLGTIVIGDEDAEGGSNVTVNAPAEEIAA